MLRHRSFIGIGIILAVLVMAVGIGNELLSDPNLSACEAALEKDLSIDTFSGCAITERRDAYMGLAPAERMTLWRDQLSLFLGPASHLTPDQRSFVQATIERLPAYFEPDGVERLEEDGLAPSALSKRFGADLARSMFGMLGTDVRYAGHPAGQTRVLANPTTGSLTIDDLLPGDRNASRIPYCSCSEESDWCCQGHCDGSTTECIVKSGCGTFWTYECDGLCQPDPT